MTAFLRALESLLKSPLKILTFCLIGGFAVLAFDGTLFRLWKIRRDHSQMTERLKVLKTESATLERQIQDARKIEFVEREARDRFDLAEETDLVFVFANDETGFDLQETLSR